MTELFNYIKQGFAFVFSQLTAGEWILAAVALAASWIATEVVKRSVTFKRNKRQPLVTCIDIKRVRIRIKWPIVISFITAFYVIVRWWPADGIIGGSQIYLAAAIVGGASPFLYFLSASLLVAALKKAGMTAAAERIEQDRRQTNQGPLEGQERRK